MQVLEIDFNNRTQQPKQSQNDQDCIVLKLHPFNQDKKPKMKNYEMDNLVPLLHKIFTNTKKEIDILNYQLKNLSNQPEKYHEIQNKLNDILCKWSDKMRKLGTTPMALGKVRLHGHKCDYVWFYEENKLFQV